MRRSDIFGYTLLILPLLLSPLLLGGVYAHVEYNVIITALVSLCYAVYAGHALLTGRRVFVSWSLVPFSFLLIWALLQLVALPAGIIESLSSRAAFFLENADISAHPLSMALPETQYSIMRLLTVMFFMIMVSRLISSGGRRWRQRIVNVMLASSTTVILLGLFFRFAGITSWLDSGFSQSGIFLYPTIINPNHAAAYFGISGLVALSVVFGNTFKREQYFFGSLFFLHTLAVVSTLSRGGILAYALTVLFMLLTRIIGRRAERSVMPFLWVSLAVSGTFYLGYTVIVNEFAGGSMKKIWALKRAGEYLSDFLVTGSGLGSFLRVFPFYQSNPERHYAQLENEPVQFLLEMGLPFGLFFFAVLLYILFRKRRKITHRNSAFAVLLFVVLHNTVDFNLHNLAVLFPASVMLVFGVRDTTIRHRVFRAGFLVISLVAAGTVFGASFYPDMFVRDTVVRNTSYRNARYAYPADYVIPFRKGLSLINSGDRASFMAAGEYVSEAVATAPDYYYNYYVTGTYLLELGSHDAAMRMYADAVERSGERTTAMLRSVYRQLSRRGLQNRLPSIISFNDEMIPYIRAFISRIPEDHAVISAIVTGREKQFFIAAGQVFLRSGRSDDLRALLKEVEENLAALSQEERGWFNYFRGYLYARRGLPQKALEFFERSADMTGLFRHIHTAARYALRHLPERAEELGIRLRDAAISDRGQLVVYYRWKADYLWKRKEFIESFDTLEKAADLSGRPSLYLLLARRYIRRNLPRSALAQLLFVRHRHPSWEPAVVTGLIEEVRGEIDNRHQKMMQKTYLGE